METNALTTNYSLPIPPIEQKWRKIVGFASIAIPSVLALWLLAPILWGAVSGMAALMAIGVLAGAAIAVGSLAIALKPFMNKQFAIWAYQLSSWQVNNYPMEVIGIYYNFLREKYQRTKDTRGKIGGKKKKLEDEIAEHQNVIQNAARTLNDPRAQLNRETIEEIEDRALHSQQTKEALEKVLKKINIALEIIALLEDVNRKKFRQFKQIMRRMSIMKEVGDLVNELNDDLRDLLGDSPQQADAEAAIEQIVGSMGQAFGQLEVLELQSKHLIAAVDADDEMVLANARQAMLESLRTVDGESNVVAVDPVSTQHRSRLLDR